MKIKELTSVLEEIAPLHFQENYDNSGLLVGSSNDEINKALICLDCTEEVIEEAIKENCDIIIAHHPIVFKGIKKLNGNNYVERTIIKAIKNNIAIYAIHTNLDNIAGGVNSKFASKLGLINTKILSPKKEIIKKLSIFTPLNSASMLREQLWLAGAGSIGNYENCSFSTTGIGTFKGNQLSNPSTGKKGELHTEEEIKIEVTFPLNRQSQVISAMYNYHPYEEVAYEISTLDNYHQNIGSGMIGELNKAMDTVDFFIHLKQSMNLKTFKHTSIHTKKIKKVALCGGSGSFLIKHAKEAGADIFITSDIKYHDFFDAENDIILADIGHYESEQYTKELLDEILNKKFSKFATHLSRVNTNPIIYF